MLPNINGNLRFEVSKTVRPVITDKM